MGSDKCQERAQKEGSILFHWSISFAVIQERQIHKMPHCPLFVPLVEEGRLNDDITRQVIRTYLSPLRKKKVDTLVLGCTHYPMLKSAIQKEMGKNVRLVDSAEETAKEMKGILSKNNLSRRTGRRGNSVFYTTDDPGLFSRLGKRFLGRPIRPAKHLPLDQL